MGRATGPVVLLGLDGVAGALVDRWADAGHLPALAALRRRGVQGAVRSPGGANDDAVWASFATARFPERHGWLHHRRIRPGGYGYERVTREAIDGTSFWQRASDAGRTVTVVDVPKSPRSHGLRGAEIVDWQVHGGDSPVPLSDPPGLADEVVARYGPAHRRACLRYGRSGDALAAWLDERLAAAGQVGDLVLDQLAARDADLVVVGLGTGHCIGHQCWHLHDADHPDHDPRWRGGDPLLAASQALDREVGRIVAALPDDATLVAFSLLGMGPNGSASGALDGVLLALDPRRDQVEGGGATAVRAWRQFVPRAVRRAMPRRWHRAAVDWEAGRRSRRSWYPVDTGHRSGGVRLNLVGREAAGVVEPGEADAVAARLCTELQALVDADTGDPVVAAVERTAGRRPGPYAGDLPDLFVHWAPLAGPPRAVRSPAVGEVVATPPDRTGHHHAPGWYVAAGPGLPADAAGPPVEVVDLGVTVAGWLGVDLPDVDGRPLALSAP